MTTQMPPPFVPHQPQAPVQIVTPGHSNGFAITSLVLGIVSLIGFGLFTGIPAIIFGGIALKRRYPGHGMSLAGVITGSIGTLLSILFIGFIIMMYAIGSNSSYYNQRYDGHSNYRYESENPRT